MSPLRILFRAGLFCAGFPESCADWVMTPENATTSAKAAGAETQSNQRCEKEPARSEAPLMPHLLSSEHSCPGAFSPNQTGSSSAFGHSSRHRFEATKEV